ncbi:MAG: type IV pilus secretin PilQ [Gammaproteobacteria bacterium]
MKMTRSILAVITATARGAAATLFALAFCGAAAAASLDNVSFSALPGDRVQLRMELSEPPAAPPLSFTIDNPARVAFDFPGAELKVAQKSQTIGVGAAHSVSAVEANGRTRVVLNLTQLVPYDVKVDGNSVVVTLEGSPASVTDEPRPVAAAPVPADASKATMPGTAAEGASLRGVDFRRGKSGEGQVIVNLSDPGIGVNIQQEGDKILVDFINARLPESLDRKLDVSDFATPVREIDTRKVGNGVRMIVKPTGSYEHLAYQSDNIFTLEVRPLTKAEQEQAKREKFGYTGERLSLNFQNIEVRAVLQLIADFTGLNMVASDTVGGNVTLRLKNVPWDQALDIILKSKGLGMRQTGNVIMVAPQEEIAAREKLELEAQQQLQELAPLRTEFVQVNYAKASDIATLIKTEANKLVSERGNVSVDERTNTLLIQETAEKIGEIRKLVSTLDIPVRQVLIESRVVIANEDFSRDLGVKFGYSLARSGNSGRFLSLGGKIEGDTEFQAGNTSFFTDNKENFIVNVPVTGSPAAALGMAVGKIGSYLIQLELSALQAEGRGEVISSPRVITANQKEAIIESGTEIPYQEASSSGATSVSFKKAVLSLRATPHITPDDRIIMDLKVNKDAIGQVFAGVPSIDTNNIATQVLVDNGETVVLGGVYEQENRNDVRRVPFFGELPYLNWLFKNTSVRLNKQELLIFVTPRILKENLALR